MEYREAKEKALMLFEKDYKLGWEFLKTLPRDQASEVWIYLVSSTSIRRIVPKMRKDKEFVSWIARLYIKEREQNE